MKASLIWNPLLGKPRYEYSPVINPDHPDNMGLLRWWIFNEGAGPANDVRKNYDSRSDGSGSWNGLGYLNSSAGRPRICFCAVSQHSKLYNYNSLLGHVFPD